MAEASEQMKLQLESGLESVTSVSLKRKLAEDNVPASKHMKMPRAEYQTEEDAMDMTKYDTSYYFSGYLRKVYPYFYEFKASCKGRWYKQKLYDIMVREFRSLPPDKLAYSIKTGAVRVNGQVIDVDYVLRGHDIVTNRVHRHEMPVLASDISIVHEDESLLVIDKPPSLPVHSCGRYRFNTVLGVLRNEHGFEDLKVVHRLDRLTSGCLLLGKTQERAIQMHAELEGRLVQKEYLCRVVGDFPDDEVTVDQPVHVICRKVGASYVHPAGKESVTTFKKLSFNGKSSLVHCFPKTGRTHQIRVHLQFLGHPIVNDPLYNSSAYGSKMGKNADYDNMTDEQLLESIRKEHLVEDWILTDESGAETSDSSDHEANIRSYLGTSFLTREPAFDPSKVKRDAGCYECDLRYKEPEAQHLMLFLHAWKYSGPEWAFETKRPFWAEDNYNLL